MNSQSTQRLRTRGKRAQTLMILANKKSNFAFDPMLCTIVFMLWLALLASVVPAPRPESNEARLLLVRADLRDVDSPGLSRVDQATFLFTHTPSEIPIWREPALGACRVGHSLPGEVRGYIAGALPLLADALPGQGIRLSDPPRIDNGKISRTVLPVSGTPGVYNATIGGGHGASAQQLPAFFSEAPVFVRVAGQPFSLPPPRLFEWTKRDEPRRLSRKASHELNWTHATDGEMWIAIAVSQPDRSSHWLVCRQPATKASYTIPASQLARLPASDSATLILAWLPKAAWRKLSLSGFDAAWAVAVHVQATRVELLR